MMHNYIQAKQTRLAKSDGVEELQAYYSLPGKYWRKNLPIITQNSMKESGLLGRNSELQIRREWLLEKSVLLLTKDLGRSAQGKKKSDFKWKKYVVFLRTPAME